MGVLIPQASKPQTVGISATTPALNFNPALDAGTQNTLRAGFDAQYQAGLAAQADVATGDTTGLGDVELETAWLFSDSRLRLLAGGSLVLPTGKYSTAPGPSIGVGNFCTLRTALQAACLITPQFAISGKVTLGLNSPNTDNQLRSANWVGVESAVGYMTPIGGQSFSDQHRRYLLYDKNRAH